jgi:WD repeat-containing protein 61
MQISVNKKAQLNGHAGSIYGLSKGKLEHLLYSAGSDKFVAEWNLQTLNPSPFNIKFENSVYSVLYDEEQKNIYAGNSKGGIHIINLDTKQEIKLLQNHHAAVFDIKKSKKYQLIFTCGGDGLLSIIDAKELNCIKIISLCNYKVRNACVSPNEELLAIACGDCTIQILDISQQKITHKFPAHNMSVNCLAFHPNGKHLISGGKDGFLNVWDIARNFELIQSLPAHNFALYGIEFNPQANLFATASRDKSIKIWDAETFNVLVKIDRKNFEGHLNSVNKIIWTDYNNYLISAGDDKTIMLWEINDV